MSILTIKDVSKRFGNRQVLDKLSFEVPEHSIYGFIGKNGAGKTTTMKLALGLYQADGGEIYVNGEKVTYGQNKTNRYIGYLPDVPEFYNFMTPTEYLKLCAEITGMDELDVKKRIPQMLEMVGLSKDNKRIRGFSRGMKQRLGIAQALLPSPKLLICDEPTSALDPVGRKEILDILKTVSDNTTVIFSTHILPDVERICDHIGILHNGSLAWQGGMDEVRSISKDNHGFEIEFIKMEDKKCFLEKWSLYDSDTMSDTNELIFACNTGGEAKMRKAMEIVLANDILVKRVEMCEPTLESVFMEVMGQ